MFTYFPFSYHSYIEEEQTMAKRKSTKEQTTIYKTYT